MAHAKRGHWQAIFEALARCGKNGVTCPSTPPRSKRTARRAAEKGEHEQAIGRSRGGRTAE
jgi:hypothetical protein